MDDKTFEVLMQWKCRYDPVFDMPVEIQGTSLNGVLTSITGISCLNLDTGFAETDDARYKLVGKGQRMILIDIDEYTMWEQQAVELDEGLSDG